MQRPKGDTNITMILKLSLVSAFLYFVASLSFATEVIDYSQYVNPLIGGSGPFDGLVCK